MFPYVWRTKAETAIWIMTELTECHRYLCFSVKLSDRIAEELRYTKLENIKKKKKRKKKRKHTKKKENKRKKKQEKRKNRENKSKQKREKKKKRKQNHVSIRFVTAMAVTSHL